MNDGEFALIRQFIVSRVIDSKYENPNYHLGLIVLYRGLLDVD